MPTFTKIIATIGPASQDPATLRELQQAGMNAARYFQQTASWEQLTASNSYSGDTYATASTINVRWFTENELVRNDDGQEEVASARVSTTTAISVGDRITAEDGRARIVIQVRKNRSVAGLVSHYVGWLK